jgi:transcription initiation factor TFIID subunit 5
MGPREVAAEVGRLRELSQRAQLSPTALPSVCCYTLHNAYEGVTALDLSPDGTLMASGHRDSFIDVWSLSGEALRAVRPSTELAAMDLSTIGEGLDVIREPVGAATKRLVGHSGPVYATRFTGQQHFLLSASQDSSLRLWSLDLYTAVVLYKSHTLPVWDVDVPLAANAGPYFASASADRTARLWSTEHVHPLRIFAGHLSDVDCVRFHPNGNYVATGSADKTVRLWDVQSGCCVRLLTGHERGVTALAVSPDGRVLASGDRLGHLRLWDLGEGRLLKAMAPQPLLPRAGAAASGSTMAVESPVYSLAFDQEGRVLASAGADGCVNLWDAAKAASPSLPVDSQLHLAAFPTKQTPLYHCQFSRRNILLTAGVFSPDF